jgi:hypothetical protein
VIRAWRVCTAVGDLQTEEPAFADPDPLPTSGVIAMKCTFRFPSLPRAACALVLASAAWHSHAVPIPQGTTVSSDVVFNFDLTADSTDFDSITIRLSLSSPDATGGNQGGGGPPTLVDVTADFFGGVDGQDWLSTVTIAVSGAGASREYELSNAALTDGLFSVGLRVDPRYEADGAAFAFGEYTIPREPGSMQGPIRVVTDPVAGVVGSPPNQTVPEVGTTPLIALGLLCLAGVRRARGGQYAGSAMRMIARQSGQPGSAI